MNNIFLLKYNHKANIVRALEDTIRRGRPVTKFVAGGSSVEVKEVDKYMRKMSAYDFRQKAEATIEVLHRMPRHWAYSVYIGSYGEPSISVISPERGRVIEWARRNHLTHSIAKEYHQGDKILAPWWKCELDIKFEGVRIGTWWSE